MKSHILGTMETAKFEERRQKYWQNLPKILDLCTERADLLHYFPAFVGSMTLNRCFTLYELYKRTLGIAGHCAEVGVHMGFGSLLFGKLIQIFEPESLTMVHGIDWFKGIQDDTDSPLQIAGLDFSNELALHELIRLQGLDNTIKIHNLDARTELPDFFEKYPHLMFKLVFLDSGTFDVVSASIANFWPRLVSGGVMIFDQFNNEVAPGETRAIRELLPNVKIETIPGSWMPSAYCVKP